MTRPTPRRPASSRNVTPRPRKLAGQAAPAETDAPAETEAEAPIEPDVEAPAEPVQESATEQVAAPGAAGTGVLDSDRATRALIRVLAVLAVLLLVLAGAWISHTVAGLVRDDPAPRDVPEGSIQVPADRPVLPSELAVEEGVDAAAHAAQDVFSLGYRTYDKDVDAAVKLMTPGYAEEFRTTAEDVKSEFVRGMTSVQVRLRGQAVVRANDTELQALIFMDQFTTRGKDQKTVISPYRVLMTMVHTNHGWLVDDVDTK